MIQNHIYQRIRAYNLAFYLNRGMMDNYKKSLDHLIIKTRKETMYGEWNDYGRLIDVRSEFGKECRFEGKCANAFKYDKIKPSDL